MTSRLAVTALVFVISGMLPPLIAVVLLRTHFIGGVWSAVVVSLFAAFAGGLIDTFFMDRIPDLIAIGGVVDAGPPLILALLATFLFWLVSRSNSN